MSDYIDAYSKKNIKNNIKYKPNTEISDKILKYNLSKYEDYQDVYTPLFKEVVDADYCKNEKLWINQYK